MTHTLPFGFVRPVCRILHTPGAVHGPTGQAGASLDPGPRMVRWTGGHTLYPIPSPGCTAWQMWPHEWTTARDVQAVIAAPLVKTFWSANLPAESSLHDSESICGWIKHLNIIWMIFGCTLIVLHCSRSVLWVFSECPPSGLRVYSEWPPTVLWGSSGCSPNVFQLYSEWPQFVLWVFSECSPNVLRVSYEWFQVSSERPPTVLWVFSKCSPSVVQVFSMCPPSVLRVIFECPLSGRRLSSDCLPTVLRVFSKCSPNVLWVFAECSPSVFRVFSSWNLQWMSILLSIFNPFIMAALLFDLQDIDI